MLNAPVERNDFAKGAADWKISSIMSTERLMKRLTGFVTGTCKNSIKKIHKTLIMVMNIDKSIATCSNVIKIY